MCSIRTLHEFFQRVRVLLCEGAHLVGGQRAGWISAGERRLFHDLCAEILEKIVPDRAPIERDCALMNSLRTAFRSSRRLCFVTNGDSFNPIVHQSGEACTPLQNLRDHTFGQRSTTTFVWV